MAMASSALSANSYAVTTAAASSSKLLFNEQRKWMQKRNSLKIRSSSSDEADCNTEECAPDKEVGKVSMEWLAGEKTKVAGTFPPRTRGWTGYVEKDTAGQTNIYSVEPAVYVAENAISSGRAGSSADGAENTLAIYGGLALISIAVASSVLLQNGKNPAKIQTLEYSGPSLSYYITKLKPADVVVQVETSAPALTESVAPPSSEEPESEAAAPIEAATITSSVAEVGGVEVQPEPVPESSS